MAKLNKDEYKILNDMTNAMNEREEYFINRTED
jgi:hypothetical protein